VLDREFSDQFFEYSLLLEIFVHVCKKAPDHGTRHSDFGRIGPPNCLDFDIFAPGWRGTLAIPPVNSLLNSELTTLSGKPTGSLPK
jgi:hypothetical protein